MSLWGALIVITRLHFQASCTNINHSVVLLAETSLQSPDSSLSKIGVADLQLDMQTLSSSSCWWASDRGMISVICVADVELYIELYIELQGELSNAYAYALPHLNWP